MEKITFIGSILSSITAITSVVVAIISAFIAHRALKNSDKTIKENSDARKSSEKTSEVMMVLEIEAQMNERKASWDESAKNMRQAELSGESHEMMEIILDYHETIKENYFNSLDRMCFCILRGYLEEKDWRTEYRTILQGTIKDCESDFGAASPYRNIKDLNNKWQRE